MEKNCGKLIFRDQEQRLEPARKRTQCPLQHGHGEGHQERIMRRKTFQKEKEIHNADTAKRIIM